MPNRVLLPPNYDAARKYPLAIFLHGSGEKGSNNTARLIHGGNLFLRDSIRKKYPVMVTLQCSRPSNWVDDKRIRDSTGKYRLLMPPDGYAKPAIRQLEMFGRNIRHSYSIDKREFTKGLSLGSMSLMNTLKK